MMTPRRRSGPNVTSSSICQSSSSSSSQWTGACIEARRYCPSRVLREGWPDARCSEADVGILESTVGPVEWKPMSGEVWEVKAHRRRQLIHAQQL